VLFKILIEHGKPYEWLGTPDLSIYIVARAITKHGGRVRSTLHGSGPTGVKTMLVSLPHIESKWPNYSAKIITSLARWHCIAGGENPSARPRIISNHVSVERSSLPLLPPWHDVT
jgi:hypothetical protein